jgi:hypothetical protein
MPNYVCEKCARIFKQKSGYTDHMNKKIDCSSQTILDIIVKEKIEKAIKEKIYVTKETLPAFFENLHNLLWYKAGLNSKEAVEHLTLFIAYRVIEIHADTLELFQDCRWTYMASLINQDDMLETFNNGLKHFSKKKDTRLLFKPHHNIQKPSVLYEIVQEIDRIPSSFLREPAILNDMFEYILDRGMNILEDKDQYYTNRKICKLAFKLAYDIKKTLRREDGTLCTFADWFCGTGGFPIEYIKGVNANLKDVNWKNDSKSIYCQDIDVTTTLLNLLILTEIPFRNVNICSANSFTDSITRGISPPFPNLEVDYCFMHPSYLEKFKYSMKVKHPSGAMIKHFLVNEDIISIGIEDDDKVSAALQLAMSTLSKNGGVCCIVIPNEFTKKETKKGIELRKILVEKYNIWYIVDIKPNLCMIVFQKGVGTTEKIIFMDLYENIISESSLEDLKNDDYSLNSN